MRVGWAAVDANAHMRSTAFLDAVNDARMHFFFDHGWPVDRFVLERIGPVLLRETIEYRHELRFGDFAAVDMSLVEQTPTGERFTLHNVMRRTSDDIVAATVTSTIGWIDLDRRRLTRRPDDLSALIGALPSPGRMQRGRVLNDAIARRPVSSRT
jgi:acyl-CoA thioester hydrolase